MSSKLDDSYFEMLERPKYDPGQHSLEGMAGEYLQWYEGNYSRFSGVDKKIEFLTKALGGLFQLCCMQVIEIAALKKEQVDNALHVWMPPHARDIWEKRRSG